VELGLEKLPSSSSFTFLVTKMLISSRLLVAIDKDGQNPYYILSIIQIMLSSATVFPKDIAMKL